MAAPPSSGLPSAARPARRGFLGRAGAADVAERARAGAQQPGLSRRGVGAASPASPGGHARARGTLGAPGGGPRLAAPGGGRRTCWGGAGACRGGA
ncbi:hypothetical protein J0S82_015040 [Galemys pyrenaicus]|uniref:Uncharacterized protein n=1 Tax=Galemys pyrenaicus TaxID=202257 RepID=A0A8J6BE70_GALPY|nr:hypothetical protein J0S82_015040 [Galemys pyrenaicus]